MSRFRILSLDGGGIRGLFAARFLAEIEVGTGKRIAEHFDLITGTSTGGIIALGLGLGLSAESIAAFYRENGPKLFRETWGVSVLGHLKQLLTAKHSASRLRKALEGVFGTRGLGESTTRLVIPALNSVEGQVHLLKTAHHPRLGRDYQLAAVDVAMATCAAPTFYPAHLLPGGDELVDGGVWANCPVMVGVLEAMHFLGQAAGDISVLSVGTTTGVFSVPKSARRRGGALQWNLHLIRLMLAGQASAALAQAGLLLGKDKVMRIDETVPSSRASLDNWRHLDELEARATYQARHRGAMVHESFLVEGKSAFVPFHPSR